ncbi:MAG: hypothetical protein IKO40_04705 [Kiritimatiellae bacterium]|nr:hypothetical protein [Kiritimatiellia bacterium]
MKSSTIYFAIAMSIATMAADADTLKIGVFNLPYRFEDTNITDIVRYVVTNDVIAYKSATTSFTPPFAEENGDVTVDSENTPGTTLYLPPILENGIAFQIENGQTNCVIKQSLTDAAKAIESELPTRTNLVAEAALLVDKVFSGEITNSPVEEIRSSICYVRASELRHPTTDEASDSVLLGFAASMPEGWTPLPLCHLDFPQVTTGQSTNLFQALPLRGYDPSIPISRVGIGIVPLVLLDGHWCICVDGDLSLIR